MLGHSGDLMVESVWFSTYPMPPSGFRHRMQERLCCLFNEFDQDNDFGDGAP